MSEVQDAPKTKGQVAYDASDAIVLSSKAERALANAKDFTVDSQDMLEAAADDLKHVKALMATVEAKRTAITGPMNIALKAVNDFFRPAKTYLDEAEAVLKRAMVTYTDEQARLAREAQRKADEAARQERERLAAEQREQERIAREAAEAAERARQEAAEAQARGDAEAEAVALAKADQQAAVAETAVAEAQAAEVTAAVVTAPAAVVPARKVAGISTRRAIDHEVTDLQALVKHVAEHPEHQSLLVVDSVKLRAYVNGLGLNTNLPGVRVFEKSVMSARTR